MSVIALNEMITMIQSILIFALSTVLTVSRESNKSRVYLSKASAGKGISPLSLISRLCPETIRNWSSLKLEQRKILNYAKYLLLYE